LLTISVIGGGITWQDQGTSLNPAVVSNGYFSTATITITLPTSPANGSNISFIVDVTTGNPLTIQAATGQVIRIGSSASSSGGTAVSNNRGDALYLIYRATDTTWLALSSQGTWNLS
jgi:hypothetical protein